MENFFTVLAWIFGVMATFKVVAVLLFNYAYNGSTEQLLDRMKGERKIYHAGGSFILAIICWVWIFTR
jgi:hypothetical protein